MSARPAPLARCTPRVVLPAPYHVTTIPVRCFAPLSVWRGASVHRAWSTTRGGVCNHHSAPPQRVRRLSVSVRTVMILPQCGQCVPQCLSEGINIMICHLLTHSHLQFSDYLHVGWKMSTTADSCRSSSPRYSLAVCSSTFCQQSQNRWYWCEQNNTPERPDGLIYLQSWESILINCYLEINTTLLKES